MPQDDDDGADSGAAYVFVRNETTWTEEAKLTASDGAVSITGSSGNIAALVGAYRHDENGSNSGAAYSFLRSGTSWIERAKVTASDAAAGDRFGGSVSISGNSAIIGTTLDDDAAGSAYVYDATGDLALAVELSALTATTLGQVKRTALLQNFPNPFNPETWIPYRLAEDASVTLTISDLTGQVVRTFKVGHQPAAVYDSKEQAIYWDGRNDTGEPVSSGIYFYHLQAGDFAATKKLIILK